MAELDASATTSGSRQGDTSLTTSGSGQEEHSLEESIGSVTDDSASIVRACDSDSSSTTTRFSPLVTGGLHNDLFSTYVVGVDFLPDVFAINPCNTKRLCDCLGSQTICTTWY